MSREHEYALYRGDDCIGTGTAKELAEIRKVKPEHIRYLSTPTHQQRLARSKKSTGKAIFAIKLGDLSKETI